MYSILDDAEALIKMKNEIMDEFKFPLSERKQRIIRENLLKAYSFGYHSSLDDLKKRLDIERKKTC